MSEPRQPQEPLELKKRARRRLVGAVAFATLAAVVLPMVMDEAPPPAGHDIDLRIPGQEQVTSSPLTGGKTGGGAAKPPAGEPLVAAKPGAGDSAPQSPAAVLPERPAAAPLAPAVAARKPEAPAATKPAASKPATEATKLPVKSEAPAKPAATTEAQRAQSILEGQTAAAGAPHVVLIGAFANVGNVKNLQGKLGELGIKTYTENLETQQGRKIRVRAGPFPNRDAAEKALEKMRRIGVGGVVAAKS